MNAKRYLIIICLIFSLVLFFVITSCAEKDNEEKLTPDRDAGETIAGAMALSTGGAIDQMADLCEFLVYDSTEVDKVIMSHYNTRDYQMHKTYNEALGQWNITVERTRGIVGVIPYAHTTRNYILKYLDADGNPQHYYVTDSDTARTVNFRIMHGTGQFMTRRISHDLDSLGASWTITNANQEMVTINGGYHRAATDTIRGWNRIRASNHQLELNFEDVVAPRGPHQLFYQAVSGHVTGTFDAVVTFMSGTAYNETTIHRDIDIVFGNGRGDVTVGSKHYTADLYLGELID